MNRVVSLSSYGLLAMLLMPIGAAAQEQRVGPVDPAAAENPFSEAGPAPGSPAEKSVLAGALLEPAAADDTRSTDFCQCVGETNSETVARIERVLRSKLTSAGFEFADAPLEEVVAFIQDTYNIPVELDTPALDEIGIGPDEPITIDVRDISLRSALRLLLKQLQLTYVIEDEVLMITTPTEAEAMLTICVYDVRDLIAGPRDAAGVDTLIDTIIQTVSTDTWAVNGGGEAAIRSVSGGLIVVSQMQAVHEQIRGLLETIREVQKARPDAGKSAAANSDPDNVLTKAYFLSHGEAADDEVVRREIGNLIQSAIPDVRWEGRLEGGEPVLLTVLPDRIVLKNKLSVHEQVEQLLVDSALTTRPTPGGRMGGAFGGGGGGGGGFFRPRPSDNSR
jgi:hypothetical protein